MIEPPRKRIAKAKKAGSDVFRVRKQPKKPTAAAISTHSNNPLAVFRAMRLLYGKPLESAFDACPADPGIIRLHLLR